MDIYVNKCQYKVGEEIVLIVENNKYINSCLQVFHLDELILNKSLILEEGLNEIKLGKFPIGGYEVRLNDFSTAFDVLIKTSDSPRYGFLSHFLDGDFENDILLMNKYHINLVQFYDWMYRHHNLVSLDKSYIDPMGRRIIYDILKGKIEEVQKYGMMAIAYGAVYGAQQEYYNGNSDDLMYQNNDKPIIFIDKIGMMDISKGTIWRKHIIEEFKKTIEIVGFDGIHMDQYGFPKYAISKSSGLINMEEEIPTFINDAIDNLSNLKDEVIIDFNYVNNWPINTLGETKQEFAYIEVWEPNSTYGDLKRIIDNAKLEKKGIQVVLAAYIHPFQDDIPYEEKESSTLLTMATIYASGGYCLLFGESKGILSDPYYVNYSKYNDSFIKKIKSYQDFIVKYKELLFAESVDISLTYSDGINSEVIFSHNVLAKLEAGNITSIIKKGKDYKTISLINLTNQVSNLWCEGKKASNTINNIKCTFLIYEEIESIYVASPDSIDGRLLKLEYKYVKHEQGRAIEFIVPSLEVWSLVYIKIKKYGDVYDGT
ncbi:glycoside hydrolase family 66 protein [Mycoplasmatota bacterium zrk1]